MTTPAKNSEETEKQITEMIIANGNACLGLGNAITGLAKLGMIAEATELSRQLKMTASKLRWTLGEMRESGSGPSNPPSQDDESACNWLTEFIGKEGRRAAEVLEKADAAGFTKTQIFQARAKLELVIEKNKYGNYQTWKLPDHATKDA